MQLSIVIVSYNVRPYLAQCLESVAAAIEGIDAEVWVVDNASEDDSVEYVRRAFPWVQLIENKANVGFSRANNAAICKAQGDFILLLNPDTILSKSTLHDALDLMAREPKAGALGTMMINHDGTFALESRRGIPTPATAFYKMSGLCWLFPRSRRFGKYYMQYLDASEASQIEIISGAFMMIRRQTLDEAGFLDEDYFMYGEDIDLSYRILQQGWQNWYMPSPILHYKGESTKLTSMRYVYNFYNAMLIFFNKNLSRKYRGLSWLVKLAVYICGALVMLAKFGRRLQVWVMPGTPHEGLMFVGSDAAWEAVSEICRRKRLKAYRCADIDAVAADKHTGKALYLTVETDTGSESYTRAIEMLRECAAWGLKLHLGTYSLKHKTLILPNDCFE